MKPILITSGEPAGVGPELCAMLVAHNPQPDRPIVILCDLRLFNERAEKLGLKPTFNAINSLSHPLAAGWHVLDIACDAKVEAGKPNSQAARYVLTLLDVACDACLSGKASAMVTAPIQKSALTPIQANFQGHTEYLADRCKTQQVVMMLAGKQLKVALATTHIPLKQVPSAITTEGLQTTLEILLNDLQDKWSIAKPKVLVCGLNPHAGESGTMGVEEITIIRPAIENCLAKGLNVVGPLPADTLFQPKYLDDCDAVLAMYHDQGLPVLKFASFGEGVNITLGLPIIRTSVDHGTALDLAGTGKANIGSLEAALQMAIDMVDSNPSTMSAA